MNTLPGPERSEQTQDLEFYVIDTNFSGIEMASTLSANEILEGIASIRPGMGVSEQLRFALLVSLHYAPDRLDLKELDQQLTQLAFQLSASTDQHAAVSLELDLFASDEPCEFSPDHIWTLVRALRVQGQILDFYLENSDAELV